MDAGKAEIGRKYLSKKGTPVTAMKIDGDKVTLRVEVTGNETEVDKSYELKPYKESEISKDNRLLMRSKGKKKKGNGKPKEGTLAALIDPYLFAGTKTIKEIAGLVTKKAGSLAKGRDMKANVRARLVNYRRKGLKVERDDKRRVKVIQGGQK